MSSTSMDISETFRAEDLGKTDFFDFVTATDIGHNNHEGGNATNDQPLQGYDQFSNQQFWGAEKDTNRLDSTIFDDLNRYPWNQQTNVSNGSATNQQNNTDGHIYTLTVLNGNESWLRKDPIDQSGQPLDLDSLLGNFPPYTKGEFSYEDSGFGTDNKDDLVHIQHIQQQSPLIISTNDLRSTNLSTFQNNNNDWQMADHNATEQNSAESLLRSALQGKGYVKGIQLQNNIAVLPSHNSLKADEELRRALFSSDQDSMNFADSSLPTPLFDENHSISSPTTQQTTLQHSTSHNNNLGVDDIFLTLDNTFTDDYEKIKRIATEVQQYCTNNDGYTDVIVETSQVLQQPSQTNPSTIGVNGGQQQTGNLKNQIVVSSAIATSEVSTSNQPVIVTKPTKKYKRSTSNINHNNNNTSNTNLNTLNNNNITSPLNGQRKERSLHYCSICSKGFKDKYSVNVHIRTHTGEKPFSCSLCGKSFRQKAHLAKHYQTHLAQKNGNVMKGGNKNNQQQQQLSQQQNGQQQQQSNVVSSQITSSSLSNSNSMVSIPANGPTSGTNR